MDNRELDALVAEYAMEQKVCTCNPLRPSPRFSVENGHCLTCGAPLCPHFSTDPWASRLLRDHMRANGWAFKSMDIGKVRRACFDKHNGQRWVINCGDADTEELAIVYAALKNVSRGLPQVVIERW